MKTLFIFLEPQKRTKNDIGYSQYPLPDDKAPINKDKFFSRPYYPNISSIIFQHIQEPDKTKIKDKSDNKSEWE